MRTVSFRLPAVLPAGLLAGSLVAASPAHAALDCAPDAYEKDSATTAALLTVGATTTRAICQEPTPEPGTENPRNGDYFVLTATGDTAYTVEAVGRGVGAGR